MAIAASLFAGAVRADEIFLKDGFTLHGTLRKEADLVIDPNGQTLVVSKPSNLFILDDRVRYRLFGHKQARDADSTKNPWADFVAFQWPFNPRQLRPLPSAARIEKESKFNDKWERTLTLINAKGRWAIDQRLTSLSPYSARIDSRTYDWTIHYLTQELGPAVVKPLLLSFPELKEKDGQPDADKRMKRYRFFAQAGWFREAEEELNQLLKDLPAEKERVDTERSSLHELEAQAIFDEAERASKAGRHVWAQEVLGRLPISTLNPNLQARVAALQVKYETLNGQMARARQLLAAIPERLVGPPRPAFAEAWWAIAHELHPDNVGRLDAFLTLGQQALLDDKNGRPHAQSWEDLQALAITGWLLGKESAEAKVATAERLWPAREMVLAYQQSIDAGERRKLLEPFLTKAALDPQELAQLIAYLPPPEPVDPTDPRLGQPVERVTQIPWAQRQPVAYVLQLPPEYHPSRPYPVLIVLPHSGEKPADVVAQWGPEAAKNGYILAAPNWNAGADPSYHYSEAEHAVVLDLIKDLRRHFQVDSGRVFLAGNGDGGTMASDVGLAHPDLFAGVIPINARPVRSATTWYWRNAQLLPFYCLMGEFAGDCSSLTKWVFEKWAAKGYPELMTIYKGRVLEFFPAELPTIFDWMSRKSRATGFPELGRNPGGFGDTGEEFHTMRLGDNHFYWVSVGLQNRFVNPKMGHGTVGTSAWVQAAIRDNNHIAVNTRGVKQLTIWLGRSFDPVRGVQEMIDFAKPVTVQINRRDYGKNKLVTPSAATMLEDFYEQGDRQRLFMAKLEFDNIP